MTSAFKSCALLVDDFLFLVLSGHSGDSDSDDDDDDDEEDEDEYGSSDVVIMD